MRISHPFSSQRQPQATVGENNPGKYSNENKFIQEIKSMLSIFRRLMKNEQGATAIEYTLIASLIAVAAIAAIRTVGGKVQNVLNNVANSMT
jgi:pilus assembly protein Flp/PilA